MARPEIGGTATPARKRRRRLGVRLVCAVILLPLIGGTAAQGSTRGVAKKPTGVAHSARAKRNPVLKMIWGPPLLSSGRSAFPLYHRLGVKVFQVQLVWYEAVRRRPLHATDPNDGAYIWPDIVNESVREAAKYHIPVCLLVRGTPSWANGGKSWQWTPNNSADYANFLTAAARRYPHVHLWMIWGEPNRPDPPNFEPMSNTSAVGPQRYAVLLNAAYHALKRASKTNVVIGGNTESFGNPRPATFLSQMRLPNGKPPPLDYYGHNPFGLRFPKLSSPPYAAGGRDINDIDTLETQLRHTYHRTVKLWLSEYTVSSDHNNRAFAFHTTRAGQARWLTAAYKLVNSVNYVAGLGWYDLLDDPPSDGPGSLTTGLMTWNLRAKPAFNAYAKVR